MKKLLLILFFAFSISSCVAQDLKVEPEAPLIAHFTVSTICGDAVTLYSNNRWWIAGNKPGLVEGKEYLMKIIQGDGKNSFKRTAVIDSFELSVGQIKKDQRAMINN